MRSNDLIIAGVGALATLTVSGGGFLIGTRSTAEKALVKTEALEAQLENLDNKLDVILERVSDRPQERK